MEVSVRRVSLCVLLLGFFDLGMPAVGNTCDVCAIYTATEMREGRIGFRVGVGEQFTRFERLQEDGKEIDNPGEHLNSSITQLFIGYDFTPRLGLQLNVPIIDRQYRRLEEGRLVRGGLTGLGDMALLAVVRPYSYVTEDMVFRTMLFGGLELPSGKTDRLGEEVEEGHHSGGEPDGDDDGHEDHDHGEHAAEAEEDEQGAGGIHGHDLTLGSGSVDGQLGASAFLSWHQFFGSASAQYAVRGKGSFDYRYANELNWLASVGGYVLLEPTHSLALQAVASGAYKGNDELDGESLGDSRAAFVFLGPGVTFTWKTSLGADLTADLPVSRHNTGVQIVPSYRIRGGVTWHF